VHQQHFPGVSYSGRRGRSCRVGVGAVSYEQPSDRRAGVPAEHPPGWYPDPGGLQVMRWWDSTQWSPDTRPLPGMRAEGRPSYPSVTAPVSGAYGEARQPGAGRHQRTTEAQGDMAYAPDPAEARPSSPSDRLSQDPYQAADWPTRQLPSQPAGGDDPPGQDGPLPASATPPKRHRVRNALIASAAGLILLLVGVSIGAAGSKGAKPSPATTVTVTAAAAPAATVTVTSTAASRSAAASAPAQSSGVLFTFSGSGIRDSAPFVVNSSAVTARYSYDCSGAGGQGNFIADLVSGSPSSGNYDDQSIANQLGSGGSQTTTVYPQDQGSSYHLEVNSECSWSITLTAG
jgi:Protein of unknown function (DUF2510)